MNVLLRIIRMALRHKWRLVGAYLCTAGATAAYLILPWLFGHAIDWISGLSESGEFSRSTLLWIVLAILAAAIVRGILSFGQTYLGESLGLVTVYDLRNTFYDHLQHLSFGFHDRQHTGNLMSRAITDVEAIRMFVNVGLVRTPYFVALFIIVPIILLRLDWPLGILAISVLPFVAGVSAIVRLHLRRLWLAVQEEMALLNTVLQENLTGIRVVKAFASEEFEEAKFDKGNTAVADGIIGAERLQALNVSFVMFAFLVIMGVILWIGGSRVINGHITPGEFAQVLFYMQILTVPVRWTGMMVSNIARAMAAGERLFEILDVRSPVQESQSASQMPRVRGHVRFENVSFSYDQGGQVLRKINIEAEPGQVIALLGPPGSGKSTIVHLIPRFYDVISGRITIDGIDVREVTLRSLRRNIGLVQQDAFLFPTTIRENIAYGNVSASTEEVAAAARVAQLDEFVQGLDDGYETVIGERGVTLSGGQRQRMSIARAVLLDPPVLILDDSTSSVDAQTEELIRKAMESVMRGRTTFIIAHRLSTVHKADQILVLEDGEIAERGTHQQLLSRGGLYRNIYDLQLRPQEEVMLDFQAPAIARGRSSS
jgi:ATP-binding cassette subfamily B protein